MKVVFHFLSLVIEFSTATLLCLFTSLSENTMFIIAAELFFVALSIINIIKLVES